MEDSNDRPDDTGSGALATPAQQIQIQQRITSSELTDNDVLLGRGKRSYNHEGNVRFRKHVLGRADAYRQNSNKAFRMALTHEIINRIESDGGRFLRQRGNSEKEDDGAEKLFEPVAKSVVRTKVKQALRDTAAGLTAAERQQVSRIPVRGGGRGHNQLPNVSHLQPNSFQQLYYPSASGLLPDSVPPPNPFLSSNSLLGTQQPNNEYARLLQRVSLQQQLQGGQQHTTAMMLALEQQRTMQLSQLLEHQQRTENLASRLTPQQQQLLGLNNFLPSTTNTQHLTTDDRGIGGASVGNFGTGNIPHPSSLVGGGNYSPSLHAALAHQQLPTMLEPTSTNLPAFNANPLFGSPSINSMNPRNITTTTTTTTDPLLQQWGQLQQQQQQQHQSQVAQLLSHDFSQQHGTSANISINNNHRNNNNSIPHLQHLATAAAAARPAAYSSSSSEDAHLLPNKASTFKTGETDDDDDDNNDEVNYDDTFPEEATMTSLRQQQQLGLVGVPSMSTVDSVTDDAEDGDYQC